MGFFNKVSSGKYVEEDKKKKQQTGVSSPHGSYIDNLLFGYNTQNSAAAPSYTYSSPVTGAGGINPHGSTYIENLLYGYKSNGRTPMVTEEDLLKRYSNGQESNNPYTTETNADRLLKPSGSKSYSPKTWSTLQRGPQIDTTGFQGTGYTGKGNINLNQRIPVQNADGSYSTEESFSVNIGGKEVLLPTIINGKRVSEEEAIRHYKETGEHLGIFDTVEDAETYATSLHNRQDQFYGNANTGFETEDVEDPLAAKRQTNADRILTGPYDQEAFRKQLEDPNSRASRAKADFEQRKNQEAQENYQTMLRMKDGEDRLSAAHGNLGSWLGGSTSEYEQAMDLENAQQYIRDYAHARESGLMNGSGNIADMNRAGRNQARKDLTNEILITKSMKIPGLEENRGRIITKIDELSQLVDEDLERAIGDQYGRYLLESNKDERDFSIYDYKAMLLDQYDQEYVQNENQIEYWNNQIETDKKKLEEIEQYNESDENYHNLMDPDARKSKQDQLQREIDTLNKELDEMMAQLPEGVHESYETAELQNRINEKEEELEELSQYNAITAEGASDGRYHMEYDQGMAYTNPNENVIKVNAHRIYSFINGGTEYDSWTGDGEYDRYITEEYNGVMTMLPKEKEHFNKLYNAAIAEGREPVEAQAFIDALQPYLNQRFRTFEELRNMKTARELPITSTIASLGITASEPYLAAITGAKILTGDKDVRDPFGNTLRFARTQQDIEEQVTRDLGDIGGFVYQAGMSGLKNYVRGLTSMGFGNYAQAKNLLDFAGEAFYTSYQNKLEETGNADASAVYALVDAGISTFFEVASVEALYSDPSSMLDYILKNASAEMSEELFEGIFSPYIHQMMDGSNEIKERALEIQEAGGYQDENGNWIPVDETNAKDAMKQAMHEHNSETLKAVLSAGLSVGGPMLFGATRNAMEDTRTGKAAIKSGTGNNALTEAKETALQKVEDEIKAAQGIENEQERAARIKELEGRKELLESKSNEELASTKEAENKIKLVEAGLKMGADTSSRKIARSIKDGLLNGKPASNRDYGRLVRAIINESNEKIGQIAKDVLEDDLTQQLQDAGETKENAQMLGSVLAEAVASNNMTAANWMALQMSEKAQEIWKSFKESDAVKQAQKLAEGANAAKQSVMELFTEPKSSNITADQTAAMMEGAEAATQEEIDEAEGQSSGKATAVIADGKHADITGFERVKAADGKIRLEAKLSDGRNVDVSLLKGISQGTAQVLKLIQNDQGKTIRTNTANALIEAVANSKDSAKIAADTLKILWSTWTGTRTPAVSLDSKTAESIRAAVQADMDAADKARAKNSRAIKPGQGQVTMNGIKAGTKEFQQQLNKLGGQIRNEANYIAQIAKSAGFDVELYYEENDTANQGQFSGADGIRINLAGTINEQGAHRSAVATFAHEVTHNLEANSAEAYKVLRSFVLQNLRKSGKNLQGELQGIMDSYAAYGQDIDLNGAIAEMVAKGCEQVLTNEQVAAQLRQQDSKTYGKVQQAVRRIVDQLRKVVGSTRDTSSRYARALMNVSNELARIWLSAYQEALGAEGTGAGTQAQASFMDKNGNVITMSPQDLEANKKKVSQMPIVVNVKTNNYTKNQQQDMLTMGVKYFNSIGNKATNEILGDIALNEDGVKHLIRWLTSRRAGLIEAIKPVIENGQIINVQDKGITHDFDSAIIAAPVMFEGKPHYMGVVIKQNAEQKNSYYFHDAILLNENVGQAPVNKSLTNQALGTKPTIVSILVTIPEYNAQNGKIQNSMRESEKVYNALNIGPDIYFKGTMEQIDAAEKVESERAEEFRKLIDSNEFMALEFIKPDGRREVLHHSTRPGIRYQLSYFGRDGKASMHENYGLVDRKKAGDVNVHSMDELYRHFVQENLHSEIKFNVLEDKEDPKSVRKAENLTKEKEKISSITERKADAILKSNGEIAYVPAQYSFAGEEAKGIYGDEVREAYTMAENGATDEKIRKKTNCIRGYNGRWWRVLDNNKMKLKISNLDKIETGKPYALSFIYDAEELYRAYPLLKYIPVYFNKLNNGAIAQVINGGLHSITYNTDYLYRGIEGIEATLQHEIQHIIQGIEWSNRGSSDTFWKNMQDIARARIANNDRQINELYSKYGIDAKNELAFGIEFNEDGTLDEEWLFPEELEKVRKMTEDELELYKALDQDNKKWVKLLQGGKSPMSLYLDTVGEIEARAASEKTDENTKIHYPDSAITTEEYTGEVISKPGASRNTNISVDEAIDHLFGKRQLSIQEDDATGTQLLNEYMAANERVKELEQQKRNLKGDLDDFNKRIAASTKEEHDALIEEIQAWDERTGYSRIERELKEAEEAKKKAQKALDDYIEQRDVAEEQEKIQASGMNEADWRRSQAVKEFGYTTNFKEAGYLLPNGKMLNFSGEKGKHYGYRGEDHRRIGSIYASGEMQGSAAMNAFMNDGNIRVMAESPGIDIGTAHEPTTAQYNQIRNMAARFAEDEYFNVDLSDERGNVVGNYEYDGRINPSKIVNDIRYFFQNGKVREQSVTSMFHGGQYSIQEMDNDYIAAVERGDMETAQRMVDDAAVSAKYTIKAYHGSPQENITQFDINNLGANTGSRDVPGFFFTNRRGAAEAYLHETNEVKPEYRERYKKALETYDKYHDSFDRLNGWYPIGNSYGEYVQKTRPEKFKGFYDPESAEYKEYDQAVKFLRNIDDDELLTKPKYTERKRTGKVYDTYLNMENPYVYDAEGSSWVPDFWPKVMASARSEGGLSYNGGSFDGIIVKNFYDFDAGEMADVYVVFDPNQIKSADPVTYDENGNVIPLSERFNDQQKDIRYSIMDETDIDARAWMETVQESSLQTEAEKQLLRDFKALRMKISLRQESERKYQREIAQIEAKPEAQRTKEDNYKLQGLKVRLENSQKIKEQAEEELAKITSSNGYVSLMYRQQRIMNDFMYGRTQEEVRSAVERLEKSAANIEKTLQEEQKKAEALEKSGAVQQFKKLLGTTTVDQTLAQLKKQYNSTWTKNQLKPYLEPIILKMKAGEDFSQDVETLAGILVNSDSTNTYEELSALRGLVITLGKGAQQELKAQHSSLKEVRARLAGTGIQVKYGERSTLESDIEDLRAEYPSIPDLGDEKDALGNFLSWIDGMKSQSASNEFYDQKLAEAMAVVTQSAAGAAKGIYMPTDAKAQQQVLAMMDFVKSLNAENRKALETLQSVADELGKLRSAGQQATGMVNTLAHDTNTAIDYFNTMAKIAQDRQKAKTKKDLIEQLKSENAQKIAKNNEEWRNLIERDKNARAQAEKNMSLRGQINTVTTRMFNKLKNPKGMVNVPEHMQGLARQVLGWIINNDQSEGRHKLTQMSRKQLEEAQRILTAWTNRDGAPDLSGINQMSADDFAAMVISQDLTNLKDGLEDWNREYKGKNKLDTLERRGIILQHIQEAMSEIYGYIRAENEVFMAGKKKQTIDAAADVMRGASGRKYREWTGKAGRGLSAMHRAIVSGNMTPEYFFRTLGNAGLNALWENYHQAENRNGLELAKAKARLDEIAKEHGYETWDPKKRTTVKLQSGDVNMTLGQMMALYATWKREQQLGPEMSYHLEGGGFYTEEQDLREGILGRTTIDKKAHRISHTDRETGINPDMDLIESLLTDEQKAYVDDVVEFMSNDMSRLGNEASRAAYGIDLYKEKYYFPFQMWDGIKSRKSNESAQGANVDRAFHPSFSKSRTHNANNALVIGDFTQTAADHIAGMINYATMGLANESLQKVLNQQMIENAEEMGYNGTKRNIRTILEEAYGKEAMSYLNELQVQLNGGAVKTTRTLYDKAISMFRKNAVAGSLSVAAQQPMSYIRAATMISPKYLAKALTQEYWKGAYEERMAHSGVSVIKDMGRFDMNAGQSAREYLMPEALQSRGRKIYEGIAEYATILPEKMDAWTWNRMWVAVKEEQKALHPEMDPKSDEFLDLCGVRFNEIMRRTQVYDSVLVRSENMRSTNPWVKSLTSFMAEPTLTLNVLADAVRSAKQGEAGGKALLAKAGATFMMSAIMQSLIKALFSTGRTPDDKKTWFENLVYRFTGNIISEANPLSLIPGYNDLVTLLKDGKLEDDAMGAIGKIWTSGKGMIDIVNGGSEKGIWRDIEDSAGQLAQLFTNIPVKNIMREGRAMYNWLIAQPYAARPTNPNVLKYQTEQALLNADSMLSVALESAGFSTSNTAYYQRIYDAKKAGKQQQAQDMIDYLLNGKGVTQDALSKGIAAAAKKDDGESAADTAGFLISEGLAADDYIRKQYKEGKMTDAEAMKMLREANPKMKEDDAWWAVDRMKYQKETGAKDAPSGTYYRLWDAMDANKADEIGTAVKQMLDHGVEVKNIKSSITKRYKDAYLAADSNGKRKIRDAIQKTYKKLGLTAEDANKMIDKWK